MTDFNHDEFIAACGRAAAMMEPYIVAINEACERFSTEAVRWLETNQPFIDAVSELLSEVETSE